MRPLRFPFFILVTLTARISSAYEDDTDNFRADVFACEEAVGHLAACCPRFVPAEARCIHHREETGSCSSYHYYEEDPGIRQDEANCLLALDCAAIQERGICERALEMTSRVSQWSTRTDDYYSPSSSPSTRQEASERLCR